MNKLGDKKPATHTKPETKWKQTWDILVSIVYYIVTRSVVLNYFQFRLIYFDRMAS